MSDDWLILIPDRPDYVPAASARLEAEAALRLFVPHADEVKIELADTIRFVDAGSHSVKVACPRCGAKIAKLWWSHRMSEDYNRGFQLSRIKTPCCGSVETLASLRYDRTQGFARYRLEVRNPRLSDFSGDHIKRIEQVLGTGVICVKRHI